MGRERGHGHEDRLREAVGRLRGGQPVSAVDLAPRTAHEAMTRQMVDALRAEMEAVRTRVDALIWTVVGAIAVDVALRIAGS